MSSDFSGGEFDSDFSGAGDSDTGSSGQPAFQQDSSEPSFSEVDTLPTSIAGGVDQLYKSQEKQMMSLRKQAMTKPVWSVNGQFTPVQPQRENFNWYVPLGGDPHVVGADVDFTPVQETMAKDIETRYPHDSNGKPLFTDESVYQNRTQIFQSLLDGADGKLTAESYFKNPHWDRIREAGASDEMVHALQKTTLAAIQPLYKQYQAFQGYKDEFDQFQKDPVAQQFIPQNIIPILAHPDPRSLKVMTKLLQSAQDKAELIKSDPVLAADLDGLKTSKDREDRMDLEAAMLSKGASGLLSVLKRSEARNEKTNALKEKLNESIESQMVGIPGDLAKGIKSSLQEMVGQGVLKDEGNLSRLLKAIKDEPGEFDWNGQKLFGLRSQVSEGRMVNAIKEAMDTHEGKDLFIDANHKVHVASEMDMDKFVEKDVQTRFGDWRIKSKDQGKLVQLPANKFTDPTGNNVFLAAPMTQQDGSEAFIPVSQLYGERQYVDRKLLAKVTSKLGVTDAQLADPAYQIELPRGYEAWRTDQHADYKPAIMSTKEFMALPEGQRLHASGVMQQAQDEMQKRVQLYTQDAVLNDPTPKQAGFWGNLVAPIQGAVAGFFGAGGGTAKGLSGIFEKIGDVVGAAYNSVIGDKEQAKSYWDNMVNKGGAFPSIMQNVAAGDKDAIEGWGLKLDDGANAWQRGSYMTANIVGRLAEMGGELAASGPLQIPKIAAYIAESSKFVQAASAVAKMIPATTEGLQQIRVVKAAAMAQMMVRLPLELATWDAVHGQTDPKKYIVDAISGVLGAGASQAGRGIRLPWQGRVGGASKLPDAARVVASTLAAAGTFGMDAIMQKYDGKSQQEILDSMKDPQQITQLAIFAIQSAFGQHEHGTIPGGEVPPVTEPTGGTPSPTPEASMEQKLAPATKQELTQRLLSGISGESKLAQGEVEAIREALKKPNESLPDEIKKTDEELSSKIAVAAEKMSPDEAKTLVESAKEESAAQPAAAEGKPGDGKPSDVALATPEKESFLTAPPETQAAALIKYPYENESNLTVTAEEKAQMRKDRGWDFAQKRGETMPFEEIESGKWQVKAQLYERPQTRDKVVVDAATEQEARAKATEIFDERHATKNIPANEETLGTGEKDAYQEMHEREVAELVKSLPPQLKAFQPTDVVGILSGAKGSQEKLSGILSYFKGKGLEGGEAIGATMDALHSIDNTMREQIRNDMLAGVESKDFKLYENSKDPEHQSWAEGIRDEVESQKDDLAETELQKQIEETQETQRQAGC